MNATIGTGTTVHATSAHGTACGSELRYGKFGTGKYSQLNATEAEVTCKLCLKAPARKVAAPAPVVVAPVAAPATETIYRRTCWKCQEKVRGTKADLAAHTARCIHGK